MKHAIATALMLVTGLSTLAASGCLGPTDRMDGYTTQAMVFHNDGTTAVPNFLASSYEVIFRLFDGLNVARTYTTGSTPTPAAAGILTDAGGAFGLSVTDVDLYTIRDTYECYDTCVSWVNDCYYDEWGYYTCNNYCDWYVTDCYDREYVVGVDMGSVSSVETYLNYAVGSSQVRTLGVASSNSVDATTNTWNRVESFVTPMAATSAAPAMGEAARPATVPFTTAEGQPAHQVLNLVGNQFQPKRTACADQAELSEAQMAKVRALREFLGVAPEEVIGRQ
ncbi:MAG: hypothetical protein IT285_03480 [Bdellovibrionales bacterium]|nr:hypothetical protein [Bdellovibrionales bacterium]